MHATIQVFCIIFCFSQILRLSHAIESKYIVPFGGNAWPTKGGYINHDGYTFTSLPASTTTYFYVSVAGKATLSLNLNQTSNPITICIHIGSQTNQRFQMATEKSTIVLIGTFWFSVGYNQIAVSISGKNISTKGVLTSLIFDGSFSISNFVSKTTQFKAGRAGFGGKLTFNLPDQGIYKVDSVYSEIIVTKGKDAAGTNFNAIGFDLGFFRLEMSQNSQRSLSFGVTSAYPANQQNEIPPAFGLQVIKLGFNVLQSTVGITEFFTLSYDWTSDTNYKFYISTTTNFGLYQVTYTAWFYDPVISQWIFIAQCSQGQVVNILTNVFVSLEPLSSSTGNKIRQFSINKFFVSQFSGFYEVLSGKFVVENGALSISDRRDVFGGLKSNGSGFILRTGGFFNETTTSGTEITRQKSGAFTFALSLNPPIKPYTLYFGASSFTQTKGCNINGNGFSFSVLPAASTVYVYINTPGEADLSVTLLAHNNNIKLNVWTQTQNKTIAVSTSTQQQTILMGTYTFVSGYNKINVNVLSDGHNSNTEGTLISLNFNGKSSNFSLNNYGTDKQSFSDIRAGSNPIYYYKVKNIENITYAYAEASIENQFDGTTHVVPIQSSIAGIAFDIYDNRTKEISFFLIIPNNDITLIKINRQNPKAYLNYEGIWHLGVNYSWVINTTYKFLYKVLPDLQTNTTNITGWFRAPEDQDWTLIGQISYLNTYAFLDRPTSEIHVLGPNVGDQQKIANFGNIFIFDSKFNREELLEADFQNDISVVSIDGFDTRSDYYGGLNQDGEKFILSTGGFSNQNTTPGTIFQKKPSKNPPLIDFDKLP